MNPVETVPCPTCGALPGVVCVTNTSGRRTLTHSPRFDLWAPRRPRNAVLKAEAT